MSYYFRHLNYILNEAGIEITFGNKKEIDKVIHDIVKVRYKDCPATWRKLKRDILCDERKQQNFVKKLRNVIC